MGYRSDVMLVVYPDCTNEEAEEFRNGAASREKHYDDRYNALKLLMQTTFKEVAAYWTLRFDDDKQRLVISEEGIKFYDTYEDVIALNTFKDVVTDLGYCMEFARIGEEYDDIVVESVGYNVEYVIRINREIFIDG